jgi:hypothetical protein
MVLLFAICGPASAINFSQTGGPYELIGKASNVNFIANYGNLLYAATDNGVWSWDGSSWSQLGGIFGLTGYAAIVTQVVRGDGPLYASTAGSGVWSWDGSSWSQVGGPQGLPIMSSSVNCLLISNRVLYAGTWNGVWVWDGTSWSLLDTGNGVAQGPKTLYHITCLASNNGTLYAGTTEGVWAWNGSSWTQLGGSDGLVSDAQIIQDMIFINGTLYVGTSNDGVFSWNGISWNKLGNPNQLTGNAISISGLLNSPGMLYAGTLNGLWEFNWSTWGWSQVSEFNSNPTFVTSLAIDSHNTFYVGTHGEGVWSTTVPSGSSPQTTIENGGVARPTKSSLSPLLTFASLVVTIFLLGWVKLKK